MATHNATAGKVPFGGHAGACLGPEAQVCCAAGHALRSGPLGGLGLGAAVCPCRTSAAGAAPASQVEEEDVLQACMDSSVPGICRQELLTADSLAVM